MRLQDYLPLIVSLWLLGSEILAWLICRSIYRESSRHFFPTSFLHEIESMRSITVSTQACII